MAASTSLSPDFLAMLKQAALNASPDAPDYLKQSGPDPVANTPLDIPNAITSGGQPAKGIQVPKDNENIATLENKAQKLEESVPPPSPLTSLPSNVSAPDTGASEAAKDVPTLGQQGPKNKLLGMLSKMVGLTADQPKPGEVYKGPTTGEGKMGAVANFAGRVGNALASAAGTPEEKELAEKRREFGPELAAKQVLNKSLVNYREGRVANQAAQIDINKMKYDEEVRKHDADMQMHGYVADENGNYRPMTAQEIASDPILSKNRELVDAKVTQEQAQTALAKAHADAIMNPSNPLFQQKERQIEAQLKMAQAHLDLAFAQNARQQESQAMQGRRDEMSTGINTQTGERLGTNPNIVPTGAQIDPSSGLPIPSREQNIYAPTSTMRNAASQAHLVLGGIPKAIQDIDALKDKLGSLSGRWNDLMQGRIGQRDPEFAGLGMELTMVASAVALAHARGRLPENLRKEFQDAIDAPQQDADNLIAVLSKIQPWMQGLEEIGTPKGYVPPGSSGGGGASARKAAPTSNVPTFGQWKNGVH